MRRHNLFWWVGVILGAGLLVAVAPVPRPAPAFTFAEPTGKEASLSSFKGKVVVVEFLLANCPHCWRVAQTLNRLHAELGPRGLEVVAVAFDRDVATSGARDFAKHAALRFPVAAASADQVDAFLGRAVPERYQVPQLVVIDRAGVIRAQSHPTHEVSLEDPATLRKLIEDLLAEPEHHP